MTAPPRMALRPVCVPSGLLLRPICVPQATEQPRTQANGPPQKPVFEQIFARVRCPSQNSNLSGRPVRVGFPKPFSGRLRSHLRSSYRVHTGLLARRDPAYAIPHARMSPRGAEAMGSGAARDAPRSTNVVFEGLGVLAESRDSAFMPLRGAEPAWVLAVRLQRSGSTAQQRGRQRSRASVAASARNAGR
jgi:hypothetical protein